MPAKATRKTSASRSTQTQGTLAFGGQNKITKPSTTKNNTTTGKKPLSKPALDTVVDAVVDPSPVPESVRNDPTPSTSSPPPPPLSHRSSAQHPLPLRKSQPHPSNTTTTTTKQHQKQHQKPPPSDPQEAKALAIPSSQITRYWKAKEAARIAPRVHQQDLTLHEKILREFDLSSQFGPCIGIPRMKRWKRADGLGLRPPLEVLAVLVREREGGNYEAVERAAMEGLLSSRIAEA